MITKQELKKLLKAQFANKRLTDEALDKLTDIVFAQLTEETTDEETTTLIEGVEPYVSLLQSEVDKVRTKKPIKPAAKPKKPEIDDEGDDDDDLPKGMADLLKAVKGLTEEVASLKGEKTLSSRKSALAKALEGLTDDQKKPYNRLRLDSFTDEEFEQELEGIKEDIKAVIESNVQRGVVTTPPRSGGQHERKPQEPSKELKEDVLAGLRM